MREKFNHTQVVIVGAGFTGLSAADELQRADIDFVLLEARDRVGGRVEAITNGLGELLDMGGQFLCDDMPEVMALARSHGKTFVDTPSRGDTVAQPPPHGRHDATQISAGSMALRHRLRNTDPNDPAVSGLTVQSWVESQQANPAVKQRFLSMIEGLWCRPAELVPLWYVIDNDRRITNRVSELQYFLKETMHSLAADIARSLGSSVMVGEPVESIETTTSGMVVRTPSAVFSASEIIVAVPPVMAHEISFQPLLPAVTDRALVAWKSGTVVKLFLRYAKPFWRFSGLSGSVIWVDPRGLYACDASHDDEHPALVVFVGGPIAVEWAALGEAALKQELVSRLVVALGPDAGDPLDILLRDWIGDRWSGGGYSDIVEVMHATDAENILRRGLPGITFASSELSTSFPGYIEGAIVAGRLAAQATIKRLQSASATRASGS
ncbi:flavin monoamine oxidase family protein [Phyllobacterium sp. LjRoot231]|uniref:flavin monoamine oxidase family protein n=1 Tax=Phyllobacterium sp. LjRoot231 TaxID=3342289 RepID=UPI003ED038CF